MYLDGSLQYRGHVMVPQLEDPKGVPLLSFYYASRWHEDVSRSTSPILLKWDEETRRRFHSTMPHVSAGKD